MDAHALQLRFGPDGRFEVDEAQCELRDRGEAIPLEPKPFALLVLLIRERERVVHRDELFAALWPDVVVGEHALSRAVFRLRQALGETSPDNSTIRTVRGVGFRFVAPVRASEESVVDAVAPRRIAPAGLLGRGSELERLRGVLSAALAGEGALVLIEGEAGIGKSRLAQEIANEAEAAGAGVYQALARQDAGAPAFWLWAQILRDFVEGEDEDVLPQLLGEHAETLARIVPALGSGDDSPPATEFQGEGRFRLFDALSEVLARAGREAPRVLVLEDLHWADRASLDGLVHLAGALARQHVLVVGTVRSGERPPDSSLDALLMEAARHETLCKLPLGPLASEDVDRLFEETAGFAPSERLAFRLLERTRGNPFFVKQLANLAAEQREPQDFDGIEDTPREIRAVVARRLAALSEACRRMLFVASVIGREFPHGWVARVVDLEREALVAAISEAVEARILERVPGGEFRYRFTHDLYQEVVYAELGEARQRSLHRVVADAVRVLHEGNLEPVVPALAHHYGKAAPLLDGDEAFTFSRLAGHLARESYAFEEASVHFRRCIDALDLLPEPRAGDRAEALVCLGFALQSSDRYDEGRAALEGAVTTARNAKQPMLFAAAVLGLAELGAIGSDPEWVASLEEAHAGLGDHRGPLRVWLLSVLAVHIVQFGRREESWRMLEEAEALAVEQEDPSWLSSVLASRAAVIRVDGEGFPEERLTLLTKAVRIAREVHHHVFETVASGQRYGALLELGRRFEAEHELDTLAELFSRYPSSYWNFLIPGMNAGLRILDGKFDEAEALAEEAFDREDGPRLELPAARAALTTLIRFQQNRLGELLPMLALIRTGAPRPDLLAAEVAGLASVGREDEAREQLAALAGDGFREIVGSESWIFTLTLLAQAVEMLDAKAEARVLRDLLAPRREHVVILSNGVYAHGPVALYLALLDRVLGDWDAMADHLETARALSERLRSPLWRAHTCSASAAMSLGRGDVDAARLAAREGLELANEFGFEFVRSRIAQLDIN